MITAQPKELGFCAERLERLTGFLQRLIDRNRLAGAATLIWRKGKIIHHDCLGWQNIETQQALHADTIYRLYSMTKPVTAVAALMLYEQGYFQLETPVADLIPEFKNTQVLMQGDAKNFQTVKPARAMTVNDLLLHTAGLSYEFTRVPVIDELYQQANLGFNGIGQYDLNGFIQTLAEFPLAFHPGTHWHYSFASDVLGYIIEKISGLTLPEFFRKKLFEPLNMVDTDFYVPAEKIQRFSANYLSRDAAQEEMAKRYAVYLGVEPEALQGTGLFCIDDPLHSRHVQPPRFHSGGGGLCGPLTDYLHFLIMLAQRGRFADQQLLSPYTVDLMTRNHLSADIAELAIAPAFREFSYRGVGHGFGVAVLQDPARNQLLGESGIYYWGGAANTAFFVDPKNELIAIMMAQCFPSSAYDLRRQFQRLVYQAFIGSE
jgi:CubicO group peptidase (beta-lactamase class C family)